MPWTTYRRHNGVANYLYLDGHDGTIIYGNAVIHMYPDKIILALDSSDLN